MEFLARCPDCGKTHLVRPERCDCGHYFLEYRGSKGADDEWGNCRKCGLPVKTMWKECPECHSDLSKAFAYRCPKCGKLVEPNAKYCECGQELIVMMGDCPYCKGRIRADSVICPKCGKNVKGGGDLPTGDVWVCGICGEKLQYYGAPCLACGH